MHSGLSNVDYMITPADLRRTLAKLADNHAQNQAAPVITPLDLAKMHRKKSWQQDSCEEQNVVDIPLFSKDDGTAQDSESPEDNLQKTSSFSGVSPALMPPRRQADTPTTFASLDAQDLPIIREYSAGGLVFDSLGRVAIIARHSRSGHLEWCLPKGHIEKGETPQETAVREIHEETGIVGEVVDSIATIDYWFTGTTHRVHKLVHHFALRYVSGDLSVLGDPDHEAEDAIWVNFKELNAILSYPNERKIAWLYAKKAHRRSNSEETHA